MSGSERRSLVPRKTSLFSNNVVNSPLVGRVVAGSMLTGDLPAVIGWEAKINTVVDVSEYIGSLFSGKHSWSGGAGSETVFTVPVNEIWWLLLWVLSFL